MSDETYCCRKCGRSMGPNTIDHDVAWCPYEDPDCYCCENCSDHFTCDEPLVKRLEIENAALKKLIEMQHNEIAKLKGEEE